MKKYLFLLLITLIAIDGFSQRSKVRTANFALEDGNLARAVENIEEGIHHPRVVNAHDAWMTRAQVFLAVHRERENYPELSEGALEKAYESFVKALELDTRERDKTQILMFGLDPVRAEFAQEGENSRIAEDYETAKKYYSKALEINAILMKELEGEFDVPFDTAVYFLKGYVTELSGNQDDALKIYTELTEMRYKDLFLYQNTNHIYRQREEYEKALEVIKAGQEVFPLSNELLIDELNIYLTTGTAEEAVGRFQDAIEIDPENADLRFALGTIFNELMEKTDDKKEKETYRTEMLDAYTSAIEINPEHFNATYNIAVIYFMEAINLSREKDNLPLREKAKYDRMNKQAQELFAKSLPYFKTAHELKPVDEDVLIALREIYVRTNEFEKRQEIDQKIQALRNQEIEEPQVEE